jgi:hypothetical protein
VGGAGPVERRKATDEELAAAKAREAKPRHLKLRTLAKPGPTAGSIDPEIALAQREAAAEPSPATEEEPAMAEATQDVTTESPWLDRLPEEPDEPPAPHVEPIAVSLAILADAVVEAIEAQGELANSEHLLDQARIRWQQARAALDAAYRSLDEPPETVSDPRPYIPRTIPESAAAAADMGELITEIPDDGPRPGTQAARDALVERIRSEPMPKSRSADRALGRQQQLVLEAAVKHRGDIKATADAAGTNVNNVRTVLHNIGKRGLLPIELIADLPAGFAKYSSVPA